MNVGGEDVSVLGLEQAAPTISMFSPSLAMSSTRSSSSASTASGPSAITASSTRCAKSRNSSLDDTGSVSQPTAAIVPVSPSIFVRTAFALAPCALTCGRETAFTENSARLLEVAVRFDQSALALHHPSAGLVAKILDEGGGDRRAHSARTSSGTSSAAACSSGCASSGAACSASGAGCSASGAGCSASGAAISSTVTLLLPACSMAFATTRTTRLQERMASSFPK